MLSKVCSCTIVGNTAVVETKVNAAWGNMAVGLPEAVKEAKDRVAAIAQLGKIGMRQVIVLFLTLLLFGCAAENVSSQASRSALDEARELAAEGKYEEALQKHIWFHNHILEKQPSYYGVRLSFALQDWIQLGANYPKALTALKGIRDEKTERLAKGDHQKSLFHDVESINSYLGENAATVELFKKLSATNPEFAGSVYHLADDALIEAKEYALAKKFLGDPMQRFSEAITMFKEGLEYAKKSPMPDASRSAFEQIFTDKVVLLITLLDQTGNKEMAKRIQKEALDLLKSPEIKNAVTD